MNMVIRKLIKKEMHQHRWLVGGAILAGVIALVFASTGQMQFNIGLLVWITVLAALAVVLPLTGITGERKECSLLFILSLPISTGGYVRAKLMGTLLCFGLPWLVLSIGAVVLVLATATPDGLLPFTALLCTFLLVNFAILLCVALHVKSERLMSAVVLVTNMAVTLFFFVIAGIPPIQKNMFGTVPVWNGTVQTVLALELAVLGIAVALPYFIAARRRDFI